MDSSQVDVVSTMMSMSKEIQMSQKSATNLHEINTLNARVLSRHQKHQSENRDYQNPDDIIAILGGVNKILTDYLSSNDINLTIDQLNKLQDVINSTMDDDDDGDVLRMTSPTLPSVPTSLVAIQIGDDYLTEPERSTDSKDSTQVQQQKTDTSIVLAKQPTNRNKLEDNMDLTYSFSTMASIHHYFWNDEKANKMIYYAYHKVTVLISICLLLAITIWDYGFGVDDGYLTFKCIGYGIISIHAIFVSLCINKAAFKLCAHHFVFWFKTLVSIEAAILHFLIRYVFVKDREPSFVNILGDIFLQFVFVAVVIAYSSIDGHHVSRTTKIFIGVAISAKVSFDALHFSLFRHFDDRDLMRIGQFEFSTLSLYASALRALSIFLWKQTFSVIKKKDKCIIIRHSPKIRWLEHQKKAFSK